MVRLASYMVAVAAIMMGIHALDQASVSEIESALVAAEIIPSASASSAASDDIHADGILDDLGDLLKGPPKLPGLGDLLPPGLSLPPISFAPLPKITSSPDNSISISLNIPKDFGGFSVVPVSQSISSSAAPSPSVAPAKGNGKRAIYDMDGEYSAEESQFDIPVSNVYFAQDEASSSFAAPVASASQTHSYSVKAVLRARGLRAAQLHHHAASASESESYAAASYSEVSSEARIEPTILYRRDSNAEYNEDAFGNLVGGILGDDILSKIKDSLSQIYKEHSSEIADAIDNIQGEEAQTTASVSFGLADRLDLTLSVSDFLNSLNLPNQDEFFSAIRSQASDLNDNLNKLIGGLRPTPTP